MNTVDFLPERIRRRRVWRRRRVGLAGAIAVLVAAAGLLAGPSIAPQSGMPRVDAVETDGGVAVASANHGSPGEVPREASDWRIVEFTGQTCVIAKDGVKVRLEIAAGGAEPDAGLGPVGQVRQPAQRSRGSGLGGVGMAGHDLLSGTHRRVENFRP